MLRKGLNPDHYPEMRNASSNLEDILWSQCLESIRQSLMCLADISQLVWQWVDSLAQRSEDNGQRCAHLPQLWQDQRMGFGKACSTPTQSDWFHVDVSELYVLIFFLPFEPRTCVSCMVADINGRRR